jgi:3-hydroxyacyl-CoA dehydrogenase
MSAIIRSAAVLGAGTMGAQIAAHLSNAGIRVLLLDVTARAAADGLKRAAGLKPDPFFIPQSAALITTDALETALDRVAEADWVIEAVVEQIEVKRALLGRVEQFRRPGAIVSSNTSAIPIRDMAEGRAHEFRRHLLGTHFFNPPRYLKLLEVIPTADTEPEVVQRLASFADHALGKACSESPPLST